MTTHLILTIKNKPVENTKVFTDSNKLPNLVRSYLGKKSLTLVSAKNSNVKNVVIVNR